ncbi:MAG: transglycosylase SLT domain-containing protein, partial [Alphaproteobacteria bacterium]
RTRHSIAAIEGNLAGIAKPLLAGDDFRYELARWYRRTGRNEHALPLIAAGTPSHELARQWWEERHIHVRHLLRQRQYQAAYELARGHKHAPGSEEFAEAEFLPGFIALRLLNQPRLAEPHFRLLAAKAPHAPDKARAHYWLGRGAEAQRDAANAQLHYRAAAQYPASFYGQLALGRISRGEFKIAAPAPRDPTDAAFYSHELVRAARFLLASGNTQVARWFLINAALHAAKTPAQHAFLAELAGKAVQPDQRHQTEVRLIRFAQRDGHAITQLGYPMLDLPDSNKTEPAMVHALIRQESEFLAQARSWVGARGLMQLMPQTAKMEAKEAKLPFSVDKLTADPKYNLTLGTNHLARLLDIYEGRYPLALAGYNAGVGATDRWLADFGDPRTAPTDPRQAKIDWIDWIELIPVDETRDYVKKVLENYAIYRLRFGEAIQIDKLVGYWREPEKLTAARQVCNEKLALAEAAKTIAKTTMAKTPVGPTGTKTAPVPPGQQIATMNADPKIMVKTPVGPTGTKNPQHLPDPPNLIGVNTTKLDVKC